MARSRFVAPHTDVLTLANGDTLIVRRRLTIGEQRESYRACTTLVQADPTDENSPWIRVPDPHLIGPAKVAAYLVDWNLAGDDEPIRGIDFTQRWAVLDHLDPDDYFEIKAAIDIHETAMAAARVAEKNVPAGERTAPAISPSPFVAAGASTGSAT